MLELFIWLSILVVCFGVATGIEKIICNGLDKIQK